MRALTPLGGRLTRLGLAFAALVSFAALAGPAAAGDWNHRHHRHRHHHNHGHFSFQFGSPGYYAPRGHYYAQPRFYYPPPAYYPRPAYYAPGPSFNIVIPSGRRH